MVLLYAVCFKRTVARDFLLQDSSGILFPQAPENTVMLKSFRISSKNRGDIRKSRCIADINDTGGK
jgi:hypothetical protein